MLKLRCLVTIHREILKIQLDMNLEFKGKVSARMYIWESVKMREIIYEMSVT